MDDPVDGPGRFGRPVGAVGHQQVSGREEHLARPAKQRFRAREFARAELGEGQELELTGAVPFGFGSSCTRDGSQSRGS